MRRARGGGICVATSFLCTVLTFKQLHTYVRTYPSMLYSSEWHASVAVCLTKTSHSVDVFPCPAHWLRRSCSGRVSSGHTLCHMHHSLHFQLCAWGGHTKGMLQWTTHSSYTAAHVRTYPILGDVFTSWALRGTYIRMYTRTYEGCSLVLIEPFEWLYSPRPTWAGMVKLNHVFTCSLEHTWLGKGTCTALFMVCV